MQTGRRLETAGSDEEVLTAAIQAIREVMDFPRVAAYIADEGCKNLILIEVAGKIDKPEFREVAVFSVENDPFLQECVQSDVPIIVEDGRTDPRTDKDIISKIGLCSVINIPIFVHERRLGIFNLSTTWEEGPMVPNQSELNFLTMLGKQAGLAMDRIHQWKKRRSAEKDALHLEEQLQRAQRLESIGRLAGGVAHDFNNLLTAAMGFGELLNSRLGTEHSGDETALHYLEQVQKAHRQAAELTNQLLVFACKNPSSPEIVDLNQIVRDSLDLMARTIGEDNRLTFDSQCKQATVSADPSQVNQVLMNLVINAADAMPSGGMVKIQTAILDRRLVEEILPLADCVDHCVVLSVRDTGTGMPPEVVEKIFDPFFTTKRLGRGSGLGLSTVFGIVQSLNGKLLVESAEGLGTEFRIYLPAAAEGSAQHLLHATDSVAELKGSGTVFLVEDDPIVLDYAETVLSDAGFKVHSFTDPLQALKIGRQWAREIDVLVTDVVMPKLNGKALADSLCFCNPSLNVVYLSGYANDIIERQGVLDDGDEFIVKPFTREQLITGVMRSMVSNL